MNSLLKNPVVGELKSALPGDIAGALDTLESLNPEAILKKVSQFLNHPIRSTWPVLRPSLIPFLFSTIGSLVAGLLLNWSIGWDVFSQLPQLTILLFPFLGMVTNIMSSMAARLKQLDLSPTTSSSPPTSPSTSAALPSVSLPLVPLLGKKDEKKADNKDDAENENEEQNENEDKDKKENENGNAGKKSTETANTDEAAIEKGAENKTSKTSSDLKHFLLGNLKVVLTQTILTSVFASSTSVLASLATESTRAKANLKSTLVLSSAALVTGLVVNTVLTTLLGLMIFISRRFQLKMDSNSLFTTVSSLRDVLSISLLAFITNSLFSVDNELVFWALLSPFILLITPTLVFLARRNPHTREVVFSAFPALFGSVLLEQPGGVMVQAVFSKHPVASAFQPLVNGIARNLVGIHYHLMSFLKEELAKIKMPDFLSNFLKPLVANFINSQVTSLLMNILIPAHLVVFILILLGGLQFEYQLTPTLAFALSYLSLVTVQLLLLLKISSAAIFAAKKYGLDPDHSALPMITSVTSLLSTAAMTALFAVMTAIGDPNGLHGNVAENNGASSSFVNGTTSTGQL